MSISCHVLEIWQLRQVTTESKRYNILFNLAKLWEVNQLHMKDKKDYCVFVVADLSNSQPVSQVSSIGQSCGQTDYSNTLGSVRGDEVGPGHNDFQDRTSVLT